MSKARNATRRGFLKGGALVAAPLAAVGSTAAAATADEKARLARLEDEAAIRDLHGRWLRSVGAGEGVAGLDATIDRIVPRHDGEPDTVTIAADGRSAIARYDCLVAFARPLPTDFTLAQMAHAQGCGVVRSSEPRRLEVQYRRTEAGWAIARVEVATAA